MGNTVHIRKMGRQALCCVASSFQGLMATFAEVRTVKELAAGCSDQVIRRETVQFSHFSDQSCSLQRQEGLGLGLLQLSSEE